MTSARPSTYRYETPSAEQRAGRKKVVVRLGGTDTVKTFVQCVAPEGGENNLHAHPHTDGVWYVLSGRSRWYGEGDALLADLGANECIVIPRGVKYWFEATGDAPLEVLHVAVTDAGIDARADREDFGPARSDRPSLVVDASRTPDP